jgi:hypothetical protein
MTPRRILVAGWLLMLVYAHPGFMSYDSVLQLLQARDHVYTGGHPPLMGVLWGVVDALVPGPLGMLVIQVTCFMAGAYLIVERFLSARAAAIATVVITLLPPISAVLAVIWKDSQMLAFLTLGTALLMREGRRAHLGGIALMFAATAMRYNAFAVTLPLVALLFVWKPALRWYARYGIALAAWLGITFAANGVNAVLTSDEQHTWSDTMALFDMTGTLRYAPDLSDEEMQKLLDGAPVIPTHDIQSVARLPQRAEDLDEQDRLKLGSGRYTPALWVSALHLFATPTTDAERAAVARAWKAVILGYPGAYLEYRWHVTSERLQLGGEVPSATYVWFTDVLDAEGSAKLAEHAAVPSKLQAQLRKAMLAIGTSFLFRPWIYLALLVVGFVGLRDRRILAVALSGLANEVVLFLFAPTIDYRYSVWLAATSALALVMVVASRLDRRARPD